MSMIIQPRKCHAQFSLILLIIEEVAGMKNEKGLNKQLQQPRKSGMESPVGSFGCHVIHGRVITIYHKVSYYLPTFVNCYGLNTNKQCSGKREAVKSDKAMLHALGDEALALSDEAHTYSF